MKKVSLLVLILVPILAISQRFDPVPIQNMFLQDVNGNPLMLRSNYDLDGTPYLSDSYCQANIKVAKGKFYRGIEVKLNLEDNRVIYKTPEGKEMETVVPLEFIEFTGCFDKGIPGMFRAGFPAIDKQNESNFYQVLDSGAVQLLKFRRVSFMDQKPYGSANTLRKYEVSVKYYAYSPEKGMVALGKGNENALDVLSGNKNVINSFISNKNIKLKKEEDLVQLFSFYNKSIPKPA